MPLIIPQHNVPADRDDTEAVRKPVPPSAYQGLKSGADFTPRFEANTAPQVEGSDPLLRSLSPFMFKVELPLVYGEQGGFGEHPVSQINVDTFTVGNRTAHAYTSARSSVSARIGGRSVPAESSLALQSRTAGNLGAPAITDFLVAKDIYEQLKAIVNAPPLVLLINPTSMRIAYTKIQQHTDRSRYGYLFHAYGEEQTKVSITAKCGAFYSGGRGVSYASKHDSVAWQNMMNLFMFYKNNGYIYDTVGKSNAHHFVGALSIRYDQWVYYGHMESFTWTYDETHPNGGIEFSLEFVASSMVDTAQPSMEVRPMRSPSTGFLEFRESVPREIGGNPSVTWEESVPVTRGFRQTASAGLREVRTVDPSQVTPFGRRR